MQSPSATNISLTQPFFITKESNASLVPEEGGGAIMEISTFGKRLSISNQVSGALLLSLAIACQISSLERSIPPAIDEPFVYFHS